MRKQGFGGTAPNKVKSYAAGMVSKHLHNQSML